MPGDLDVLYDGFSFDHIAQMRLISTMDIHRGAVSRTGKGHMLAVIAEREADRKQMSRWQVAVTFDIFTEAALFAVALFITLGLQLTFSKKFVVLLAFGLRVP